MYLVPIQYTPTKEKGQAPNRIRSKKTSDTRQTNSRNFGRVFKFWGSENSGNRTYEKYKNYTPGTPVVFRIAVGQHYTGAMTYLLLVNDDDKSPQDGKSRFSNIRLYESGADSQDGLATFVFRGEAADSASAFAGSSGNLSGRPLTKAAVVWLPAAWPAGICGPKQLSPNLGSIVQEIVDRPGWSSGNAVAFMITGEGRRVADTSEKPWGHKPTLKVRWTDTTDVDGDSIPDAWERTAGAPSLMVPGEDSDGDGAINWHEYLAGTDAGDRESVLKLDIRGLADGRVAVGFQGRATAGLGYEADQKRYYTLETAGALSTAGGATEETLWLEDFALPDGTQTDTGETAWTTVPKGTFAVYDGCFKAAGGNAEAEWRSEPIAVMGVPAGFSLDIRSQGNLKQGDYIKVFYSVDDGPETLVAERYDNFNANAWETIGVEGLMGLTVRIVIRARGEHGDDTHYWDNIRVWGVKNPDWPAVPGVSNVLVTTDRLIEYTNNTPAKTGFYRLKTKLE